MRVGIDQARHKQLSTSIDISVRAVLLQYLCCFANGDDTVAFNCHRTILYHSAAKGICHCHYYRILKYTINHDWPRYCIQAPPLGESTCPVQ